MYIMVLYSAIMQNEIMAIARKWMELEIIMLSEISQTQGENILCFPLICGTQIKIIFVCEVMWE